MKILVTGTAGFVGFHLANRLLNDGHVVIGIDSINDYYDVLLKHGRLEVAGIDTKSMEYNQPALSSVYPAYTFYYLHLENKEALQQVFEKHQPEIVINLAAQAGVRYSIENPDAYVQSNLVGFANLLECCRYGNIKHLLFASSSSVYGLNDEIPFTEDQHVDHPISFYAATKKSNELMAHVYSHLFRIPVTGLRFFTVYGPWGRPDMALFLFTKNILDGKPIKVFNNGNMQRDFTYIDDIIEGVVRAMHHPPEADKAWTNKTSSAATSSAPYKIYNIGHNSPINLLDFIDALEAALGIPAKREMLPMQPGEVLVTYANVESLVHDVGYMPSTGIAEGVKQFINWYKDFYKV